MHDRRHNDRVRPHTSSLIVEALLCPNLGAEGHKSSRMRTSLIDIALDALFLGFGAFAALALADRFPSAAGGILLSTALITLILYLVTGHWFYKRFQMLPRVVPRCPDCGERGPYLILGFRAEARSLLCTQCEGYLEIWPSAPPKEHAPSGYHELRVRFPHHIGGYSVLHREGPQREVVMDLDSPPGIGAFVPRELEAPPTQEEADEFLAYLQQLWPDLAPDGTGDFVGVGGLVEVQRVETVLQFCFRSTYHRAVEARNIYRLHRCARWVKKRHPDWVWRTPDGTVFELESEI